MWGKHFTSFVRYVFCHDNRDFVINEPFNGPLALIMLFKIKSFSYKNF